jgi:xanthine dehydrogenase small subunit
MSRPPRLWLNGREVALTDVSPTTTLLDWLRARGQTGTKEGCAEGDCGACTVAVRDPDGEGSAWRSVCSCILPVAAMADREVVTVEGVADGDRLHPAQQAMVDTLGSQCGYCTPGFVMSLFEATYRPELAAEDALCAARKRDQLCGNLCRCTGYRPIRDALDSVAGTVPEDRFAARTALPLPALEAVDLRRDGARFLRPTSWDQLWAAAAESEAPPRYLAGGTDLGLDITKKHASWPLLVDLSALPDQQALTETDDGWTIGGGVRLSELEDWSAERLPMVARMLRYFASRQIKNRATVAGNLCNASPIGDLPPVLLALDAELRLRGPEGDRTVPVDAFFLDYRQTALQPGEVLREVFVPRPPTGSRMSALKVSKRRELDISAVAAAFVVATDDDNTVLYARLAYGGMAATPSRALEAEAALRNRRWGSGAVEAAVDALRKDFQPLDDHRGSAWYRETVAANLLRGFLAETADEDVRALPDRHSGTVLA